MIQLFMELLKAYANICGSVIVLIYLKYNFIFTKNSSYADLSMIH